MNNNETFHLTYYKTVETTMDQCDFNTIGDSIENVINEWLWNNIDGLEDAYDVPVEYRKELLKAIVTHMLSSDFRWGDYAR